MRWDRCTPNQVSDERKSITLTWEPEKFTREQRRAAGRTVVRAQVLVDRLDRNEFGIANAGLVTSVYRRIDDLLSLLYQDLYGLDESKPILQSPGPAE